MENNNTPVYINVLSKQAWNLLSWLKANQSKDKYARVAGFHLAAEGKAIFSTDNRTCIAALLDCAVPELEGLPDGFYKIVKVSKDLAILENSEEVAQFTEAVTIADMIPF